MALPRKRNLVLHPRFLFFCILLPITWFVILNAGELFSQWIQIPQLVFYKIQSIFSLDKLRFILELRDPSSPILSRLYFNKVTLLVNDLSEILTLLSPKSYFAENSLFSGVEAVPIILLPFWFIGFKWLIKKKRYVLFSICLALFPYLTGQKNMYFMFPLAFFFAYMAYQGVLLYVASHPRFAKPIWIVITLYSLVCFKDALFT